MLKPSPRLANPNPPNRNANSRRSQGMGMGSHNRRRRAAALDTDARRLAGLRRPHDARRAPRRNEAPNPPNPNPNRARRPAHAGRTRAKVPHWMTEPRAPGAASA